MRKTIAALALSTAAAGSLLLAGSAHAATTRAAGPAERPWLPGYDCISGFVLRNFPPTVIGRECAAVNGAPEGGPVEGPVRISILRDGQTWICRFANADNYPDSVLGHECFPEGEGPF